MARPGKGTWPPSATEIDTARKCWRMWGARYAGRFWPKQEIRGGEIGNELHAANEHYARTGQEKEGLHQGIREMFLEGLPYLPFPNTHWLVEEKRYSLIAPRLHPTLTMQNKMDWMGPSHALPKRNLPAGPAGLPVVMDYKSTSVSLGKKGQPLSKTTLESLKITRESKLDDVQTIMYAAEASRSTGGQDVYVRHLYYRKTRAAYQYLVDLDPTRHQPNEKAPLTPSVLAADAIISASEIEERMEQMVYPTAEKLYQIRSKGVDIHPQEFTPNYNSCYDPFPCSYLEPCTALRSGAVFGGHVTNTNIGVTTDMSFNLIQPGQPQQQMQFPQGAMAINPPVQQQQAPQGFAAALQQQVAQQAPAAAPQQMPQFPQGPQAQPQSAPVQQPPQYVPQQAAPQFPTAPAGFPSLPQAVANPTQAVGQIANTLVPPTVAQAAAAVQASTGVSDAELGAALRVILRAMSGK